MLGFNPAITIQDLFGIWQTVEENVRERARQTSFTWHSEGRFLGHCPSLELEFQAYVTEGNQAVMPYDVLLQPVLNIFVMQCDTTTTYKDHVKQLIAKWHGTVIQRQPHQEYIILHVVSTNSSYSATNSSSTSKSPSSGSKGSILDKLKGDFNGSSGSMNRCFQLRTGDDKLEMEDAYTDLISGIMQCIRRSLHSKLSSVEVELEQLQHLDLTAARTFEQLFLSRDRLAHIFESMKLTDEALMQYAHLLQAFERVAVPLETMYFPKLMLQDWSALCAEPKLLIEELEVSGAILLDGSHSVLAFRLYIFAAAIRLLCEAGKFEQALDAGLDFVSTIDRLVSMDNSIEAKAVGMSSLINWILAVAPNDHYSDAFAAARGDLCNYRLSLFSHVDTTSPTITEPHNMIEVGEDKNAGTALSDGLVLSRNQRRNTEQALADYRFSQRHNASLLLEMDCVLRYRMADTQISISKLHELGLECLSVYENSSIKADIAIELLADVKGSPELTATTSRADCYNRIFSTMVEARNLPLQDVGHFGLTQQAVICDVPAGLALEVMFESTLPFTYTSGIIRLALQTEHGQIFEVSAIACLLSPGENYLKLTAQNSFSGNCMVHSFSTTWGKICFSQNQFPRSHKIAVHLNHLFIPLSIDFPRSAISTTPKVLEICITTVEFELKQCQLTITALHPMIRIGSQAIVHNKTSAQKLCDFDSAADVFALGDLANNSRSWIELSYDILEDITELSFEIEAALNFFHDSSQFTVFQRLRVHVNLPLAIRVQEVYRGESLFSRYHVACDSSTCLKVNAVLLTEDGAIATSSFGPRSEKCLLLDNQTGDDFAQDYCLEVPIDLPAQVVVHTVDTVLRAKHFVIGQRIQGSMSIVTRYKFPPNREQQENCFYYELEVDEGSWLLAGKVRGLFSGQNRHDIQFDLVPLHNGLLNYPLVTIQPSDNTDIQSEVHIKTMAKTAAVL
ncbi:protein of unknown function [Taphrina deformans PYCC 5710]|uniref:Trafficking protein particle complex subunit 10 n=1 Tax=Taphrina deformans (strain PYCC 5710 / ATCC 11124 / CBS 356.35 / IMI 108563 / JCM 9778 / NBRC 8474) TaxID=1097556 RepID=R4XGP5_TAPDE|nr:protein of unknown function [Taphrina deformans PYCC 5710]|eukprot:CCG84838.1 protein of unknown function [Taphrina deformans PYCC 5710]